MWVVGVWGWVGWGRGECMYVCMQMHVWAAMFMLFELINGNERMINILFHLHKTPLIETKITTIF